MNGSAPCNWPASGSPLPLSCLSRRSSFPGGPSPRRLSGMRIAVCQVNSRDDRAANLKTARELLERAAAGGADLAVLPEYVDYLGRISGEPAGETVTGTTATFFAEAARDLGIWVHAGSFHEIGPDPEHSYNTSIVFDRSGAIAATYRKIHLYDVDIPGRVTVKESARCRCRHRGGRVADRGSAVWSVDLLRPAVSRALPTTGGQRRRVGAGRAGRVHDAHRSRSLGGAAASPGDRKPVLRRRGRRRSAPTTRTGRASAAAWSSIRGAPSWRRRRTRSA